MKLKSLLVLVATLALFGVCVIQVNGASITINGVGWSTSYSDPLGSPVMNETKSTSYDMSDLTGLVVGNPIRVILDFTGDSLIWVGGFSADTGPLAIYFAAQIQISIPGFSGNALHGYSVSAPDFEGGVGFTNPVGYATLFGSTSISFSVPWGTDLSSVAVKTTDVSTITGTNAVFTDSSIDAPNATLSTTSVPEPSAAMLLLVAGSLCFRRRRINTKTAAPV